MNVISIPLRIYRRHVVIFIGASRAEIVRWGVKNGIPKTFFTEKWYERLLKHIEDPGCDAFTGTYGEGGEDILIWMQSMPTDPKGYGTLSHEIYHAVDKISYCLDSNSSFGDGEGESEPRAYLFEYILREALIAIMKKAPRSGRELSKKSARRSGRKV